jgi:hypothetical protein
MKSCTWLVGAAAALFVVSSSPVVADEGFRGRPAFVATDAATGAAIRVYRGDGRISLEVDHPSVQIRKQLFDGQSTTQLRSGGDAIAFTLTRESIGVSSPAGQIQGGRTNPERVPEARAMLAASPLVARAAALIGRMQLPGHTPLRQTLFSTRALLLAFAGENADALREVERSTRALTLTAPRLRFTRTSATADPGECWDTYSKEAIAIYMEYEDCMNNEQWWDVIGTQTCLWLYEVQAIGAFAWWLSCVGLNG